MNRNRCLLCHQWHPWRLLCEDCAAKLERGVWWAVALVIPAGVGVLTWLAVREAMR